jgi:hypothetical protein
MNIKFGDIGSLMTTPESRSFKQPEKTSSEKSITWGLGLIIISLIGGIYFTYKEYVKKMKDSSEFKLYITSLIQQTKNTFENNIKKEEYDTTILLGLIDNLLNFDPAIRYSIKQADDIIKTL